MLCPDHLVRVAAPGPLRSRAPARRGVERALFGLAPGVTELCLRPALDTAELRSMATDWPARVDDFDLAVSDRALAALVQRAGAVLIGYREIREAQRAAAAGAATKR